MNVRYFHPVGKKQFDIISHAKYRVLSKSWVNNIDEQGEDSSDHRSVNNQLPSTENSWKLPISSDFEAFVVQEGEFIVSSNSHNLGTLEILTSFKGAGIVTNENELICLARMNDFTIVKYFTNESSELLSSGVNLDESIDGLGFGHAANEFTYTIAANSDGSNIQTGQILIEKDGQEVFAIDFKDAVGGSGSYKDVDLLPADLTIDNGYKASLFAQTSLGDLIYISEIPLDKLVSESNIADVDFQSETFDTPLAKGVNLKDVSFEVSHIDTTSDAAAILGFGNLSIDIIVKKPNNDTIKVDLDMSQPDTVTPPPSPVYSGSSTSKSQESFSKSKNFSVKKELTTSSTSTSSVKMKTDYVLVEGDLVIVCVSCSNNQAFTSKVYSTLITLP